MNVESHGLITSRGEFHQALRRGFAAAAAAGCRELWLCDPDFADWPLGDRAVVEHMSQWAASQRRMVLLAASFDDVVRRHPRWVAWRRQWAHVVHCHCATEIEACGVPTLLVAAGLFSVRLSDPLHHRGRWSTEPADEFRCRDIVDANLQRSVEAFPVTVTGL